MSKVIDFLDDIDADAQPVDHGDLSEALEGMASRDDLLEAVRKLRSFVEEQDRKHISNLRQEMAELKSIAGTGSGGGSGLMAAGLVQLEKRLDSDVSTWQSRHAKALQETSSDVSDAKQRCKNLEKELQQAWETVGNLLERLVAVESIVESLPAMLQGLLGALPVPSVTLPESAISVLVDQVAPIVNVSTPKRTRRKRIVYDSESRPSEIEETEEDADSGSRSILDPKERRK